MSLSLFSVDLLASRRLALASWASVSPYAGVSTYLARSHEKTAAVDLDDESVLGAQGMVGAALHLSGVRLAAEYGLAKVQSLSFKVGFGR